MKRSEMIERLAKWLDRSKTTVLMNGNEGKAKILLDQLEKLGMIPPSRQNYDKIKLSEKYPLHSWELENEKDSKN